MTPRDRERPDWTQGAVASSRRVETSSYAAFVRRSIRAYGRRVADGELEDLAELVGLRDELDDAVAAAVAGLRAEPYAYSWSAIAEVLGVTRQAASQHYPNAGGARRRGGQPSHLR